MNKTYGVDALLIPRASPGNLLLRQPQRGAEVAVALTAEITYSPRQGLARSGGACTPSSLYRDLIELETKKFVSPIDLRIRS